MKPLQHARITAHRYSGEWQDWTAIHDWIDRSKAIFPSLQRRMFLHSDFGEWLAVRIYGEAIIAEGGTVIPTRDLFRDHQVEDLGQVVTLAEWLREIDADYWTRRRKPPRQLEQIREEPAEGLAARWGGVPGDYHALIDFFDKPSEFAPDNPDAAALITHNSFGIFLAEELLGTIIALTETNDSRRLPQIISTRSAAEDLVYARIGSIPPAGNLAAHTSRNPEPQAVVAEANHVLSMISIDVSEQTRMLRTISLCICKLIRPRLRREKALFRRLRRDITLRPA